MTRVLRKDSLHEQIIDRLIARVPGARRFKFKQCVLDAVWGKCGSHETKQADDGDEESTYEDCDRCFFSEQIGDAPRPDAFVIDTENREVIVYEVEVTHQVSTARALQYADLFWVIDEEYWLVRLIVVDRFEHEAEVDVVATEWAALRPGISDSEIAAFKAIMGIRIPRMAASL